MPTFGSLLVIIGGSLLYTRLYGGAGESEDSPNGAHKKRAPTGALFLIHSPQYLWRAGLPALGREAAPKPVIEVLLMKHIDRFATASQPNGGKPPRHKCAHTSSVGEP